MTHFKFYMFAFLFMLSYVLGINSPALAQEEALITLTIKGVVEIPAGLTYRVYLFPEGGMCPETVQFASQEEMEELGISEFYNPEREDKAFLNVRVGEFFTIGTYQLWELDNQIYKYMSGSCGYDLPRQPKGYRVAVYQPVLSSQPVALPAEPVAKASGQLDLQVLTGPGLRFDSPLQPVNAGGSLVVNLRPQPSWWVNTKPGWTFGYQFWLDARKFGTYYPGLSWGLGGTVGHDWAKATRAGTFTLLVDAGLLLGTGVHGTSCAYNARATAASQVNMTCGGFDEGFFPKEILSGQEKIPGSFYGFFGGGTVQALVRLNVKNTGFYVGAGAWALGQVFILPGRQLESLEARMVLANGREVIVPYHWGAPLAFGAQMVPAIMVGRSLP